MWFWRRCLRVDQHRWPRVGLRQTRDGRGGPSHAHPSHVHHAKGKHGREEGHTHLTHSRTGCQLCQILVRLFICLFSILFLHFFIRWNAGWWKSLPSFYKNLFCFVIGNLFCNWETYSTCNPGSIIIIADYQTILIYTFAWFTYWLNKSTGKWNEYVAQVNKSID